MAAIGVVATLVVQDGKQADFEAVFTDLRQQVKANEPGCEMYDFYKSKSDPTTYVVMERYKDEAALTAHGNSDHFKAAGAKLGALLGGAPSIEYLNPVE